MQWVGFRGLGEYLLVGNEVVEMGFCDLEGEQLFEDSVGLIQLLSRD